LKADYASLGRSEVILFNHGLGGGRPLEIDIYGREELVYDIDLVHE